MHTDERFLQLIRESGTRADVLYKIELLKEFFEFAFFKRHATSITDAVIDAFGKDGGRSAEDGEYLEALRGAFFADWTEQNFYGILADFEGRAKTAPTFELVTPAALLPIRLKQIGEWVRKEVGGEVLLAVEVDPSIAAGCRFVWKNTMYDFSLAYYLKREHERLEERLSAMLHA